MGCAAASEAEDLRVAVALEKRRASEVRLTSPPHTLLSMRASKTPFNCKVMRWIENDMQGRRQAETLLEISEDRVRKLKEELQRQGDVAAREAALRDDLDSARRVRSVF